MPGLRTLGTALLVPVLLSCGDHSNVPTNNEASFDEGNRAENLGSGNRFKLIGTAEITRDPENATNVVLRVESDGATPVGVARDLRRVQLFQLDHHLNFHRAFVAPHSCGGGSPRIILLVDADGDGDRDFSANGHVRPGLNNSFAFCESTAPTGAADRPSVSTLVWRFEDVTDEATRWEITGGTVPNFPAFPGATWDQLEALVHVAFPNHQVLQGRLIEDFNNTGPGVSYYDLVTIFDLTLGTEGQWQPERRNDNND